MGRIVVCVLFCLHWFCFDQPWSVLVRLILILDPDLWSLFLDPDPGRGPVDGDNQVNHERRQFLRLLGMHWTALTGLMLFSASPCLVENSGEAGSDWKYPSLTNVFNSTVTSRDFLSDQSGRIAWLATSLGMIFRWSSIQLIVQILIWIDLLIKNCSDAKTVSMIFTFCLCECWPKLFWFLCYCLPQTLAIRWATAVTIGSRKCHHQISGWFLLISGGPAQKLIDLASNGPRWSFCH